MSHRVMLLACFAVVLSCTEVHEPSDAGMGVSADSGGDAGMASRTDAGFDATLDASEAPDVPGSVEDCDGGGGDARIDEACRCAAPEVLWLGPRGASQRRPHAVDTNGGVAVALDALADGTPGAELVLVDPDGSIARRTVVTAGEIWRGSLSLAARGDAVALSFVRADLELRYFAELDASGALLGPVVSPPDAPFVDLAALAAGWARSAAAVGGGVEVRLLASGGATIASGVGGTAAATRSAIAWDGGSTLGVVYETPSTAPGVVFQAFDVDGSPTGAPLPIGTGAHPAAMPAIVGDESGFFVAWSEPVPSYMQGRYYVGHVAADGTLDVGPLELALDAVAGAGGANDPPSLALDDDGNLGVVYTLHVGFEGLPELHFVLLDRFLVRIGTDVSLEWGLAAPRALAFDSEAGRFAAAFEAVSVVGAQPGVWFPCSRPMP